MDDVRDVQASSAGPAPGWYADPGGSDGVRWWDGVAWTTAVRARPDRAAVVSVTQLVAQPVPDAAGEDYGGDPRFGGVGTAPVPTRTAAPQAVGARPHHAITRARTVGLPRWTVAVGAALLVLASLVAVKLLTGGGSAAPSTAPTAGLGGGDARANVAAMEADVRSVAVAEETEFTEHQAYAAAASAGGRLAVGSQVVPLSSVGATTTVTVSPSRSAYCVVARRIPLGGGVPQVVVYVSSAGGLQPRTVTSCPMSF